MLSSIVAWPNSKQSLRLWLLQQVWSLGYNSDPFKEGKGYSLFLNFPYEVQYLYCSIICEGTVALNLAKG